MTLKTEGSTKVTVICPSCSENNELEQHKSVGCSKCDKPITGKKYKTKAAMPAVLAFTIGFAGYSFVDRNLLDSNRYPLELEYAMVNACANGDMSPIPGELYDSKQALCVCAVERVVEEMAYSELKERNSEIPQILANKMDECV